MFARVAIYEVPEDRQEEARAGFKQAVERIRSMPGLTDALLLFGIESNRALTITLWESREAMTASRVVASRLRGEAAGAVEGDVLSVDEFEVVANADGDD